MIYRQNLTDDASESASVCGDDGSGVGERALRHARHQPRPQLQRRHQPRKRQADDSNSYRRVGKGVSDSSGPKLHH